MHLPADLFLSLRYLRPKRTFISTITLLSIMGPALGVAILIIVSSVMAGFDRDIRRGIMDMQAHLQIYSLVEKQFSDPMAVIRKLEPYGLRAAPLIEGSALLQIRDQILPKIVRGIVPEMEKNVSNLCSSTYSGRFDIKDGECVIGDRLAMQIGLRIGDTLLLHSPARLTKNVKWREDGQVDVSQPDELYLPEQVKIAGFFSTGVADFDDNIVLLTLDQAADLFGYDWGSATVIQAKVPEPMAMDGLVSTLRQNFEELAMVTWQERNQLLFGTLRVEKNLMTFLMAFIVLVASFSIAATLITVAVQKTREIGLLKAVGMSRWAIVRIFLFQGGIIGLIGTTAGVVIGLAVMASRETIAKLLSKAMGHDVFPAELYHLTQVPSLTTWDDLSKIIAMSLCICIFAALVPALYASSLAPARALQED